MTRTRTRLHARRVRALPMLVAAALALLSAAPAASAATLAQRIDAAVGASGLRAGTGVMVWDQQTRLVLYSSRPGMRVAPASTQKLLTSLAAMRRFGADHRFTTTVAMTGRQEGTRWIGSVWLVGGGDPTLSTADFARRNYGGQAANIARLADPLAALGVTQVTGRVFVVDDHLDELRYVPAWPVRYRYDESAALGGLTVNQSHTGRWIGGPSSRVPDVYAGRVYRALLQRRGVTVLGGVRPAPRLDPRARALATVKSPQLATIVRHMNQASDNFFAEILLKDLGREVYGPGGGTTRLGARAAWLQLRAMGVDMRPARWVDGSGLSDHNRVTARQLGQVLGIGAQADFGEQWIASFAVSGWRGTLRTRMRSAPYRFRVKAKTGTLRHTSALAGFAQRAGSERRYGFAVVSWNASGRSISYSTARRLQDRVAMTLVR